MQVSEIDPAFRTVFEPHRRPIIVHCYRMLGSLQDAEEIAQEALLRAWQRQRELNSTHAARAWLYKIATSACLDHLRKARRRRALPHLIAPSPSKILGVGSATERRLWVEPAPDALLEAEADIAERPDHRVSRRESIGLAFITALQFLSPKQRAALLLVDVLGWAPEEAADLLATSTFSVNSLLQRARKGMAARRDTSAVPDVSSVDTELLQRFIAAWEGGDLEALAALLADDARLSMPPQLEWYAGRESVRAFFEAIWSQQPGQRRLLPLGANGGLAVAIYRRPLGPDATYESSGIMLIALRAGRISEMTRFGFTNLFPLFGLPSQLA